MSEIFKIGQNGAPVVIVTDWTPLGSKQRGMIMSDRQNSFLAGKLRDNGFGFADCVMINPCPQNEVWARGKPPTDKQHGDWVAQYSDEFDALFRKVADGSKVVLVLGKSAARQLFKSAVKVTKARGAFGVCPITGLPTLITLSPAHVMSRPEVERDFDTDIRSLSQLRSKGWKASKFAKTKGKYEICLDLSDWIKNPPPCIAADTETTGLSSFKGDRVLCIPLTAEEGESRVIPVSSQMFPDIPRNDRMHALDQVRTLAANPKIKWFGHNFKFDLHMLYPYRIIVANWWMDTLQLAFAADENMQSKSLKECIRRWVREMAGYSDAFDAKVDKGRLLDADPAEVVQYAGGDTDGTFRLCKALVEEVMRDKKQWATVVKIQMPALRMFLRMERQGMRVSPARLRKLSNEITVRLFEVETAMLKMVPKVIRQKHFDQGLSFGRKEFLSDVLFSKDGFKLKAVKFIANGSPSTDAIHLANFATHPFVELFTEYQKLQKMKSTYIGLESGVESVPVKHLKNGGWPVAVRRMTNKEPEEMQDLAKLDTVETVSPDGDGIIWLDRLTEWDENGRCLGRDENKAFSIISTATPTGLWQHITEGNIIHPSFYLDRTVTGRSSSKDPNFQNVPKRAKTEAMKKVVTNYRRVFIVSKKGNVFLESDLSQAELRIAAVESMDPVMLSTYRSGGDIHALTGSKVAGVALKDVTKDHRQKAKAVNFGFLYTMGVDSFIIYARTQYGVTFTKSEAEKIRETYFKTYAKLKEWHNRRRYEVRKDGFVRALHGAKRTLPSINSADRGVQAEAERQAINSPIQRLASDITLLAMVQFSEGCPDWVLPIGTIHDSGVAEVPERKHKKAASWMKWCFINPGLDRLFGVKLPIPMGADVAVGPDLGSMEEMKDVEAVKPPWIR